jgi:cytochrome c5
VSKSDIQQWLRAVRRVCLILLMGHASVAEAIDDGVRELYSMYCASCHGVKGTAAPEAFNQTAWKKRMAKGTSVVLANAVRGVGNMPPSGTCGECTQSDLQQLIQYMSSPKATP